MYVINARNVHDALPLALRGLDQVGIERESRNGPVKMFPMPVTTVYERPLERVIFWPERDANPFFHFFESLWMLAGRQDVNFVAQFVKNMRTFSDDGKIFHAAYGHRWRQHFQIDQLETVCEMLKKDPNDRRAVVTMWDPTVDGLGKVGKDFPCNMQAIFSLDPFYNKLNMTVTNRSNDIVWGCYGANAVHFSYLLEFMAAGIGCGVGKYYQVSNNLHAYLDTLQGVDMLKQKDLSVNPYDAFGLQHVPLVNTDMTTWHQDLQMFMEEGPIIGFRDQFFRKVAVPLWNAHKVFKDKADPDRFVKAQEILDQCKDTAWHSACREWLTRREVSYKKAVDDGVSYE